MLCTGRFAAGLSLDLVNNGTFVSVGTLLAVFECSIGVIHDDIALIADYLTCTHLLSRSI